MAAALSQFIIMSLTISSFIALLFPVEVGLADPLGLNAERTQSFTDSLILSGGLDVYYTDGTFFDSDGNVIKLDENIKDSIGVPAEGDQSVVTDTGFGFLDYPRIVANAFSSFIIYLIIPVLLMFNLGYPFNLMFSLIYGGSFIFAILSWILGR